MSATLALEPGRPRHAPFLSGLLRFCRLSLMGAGLVLLAALAESRHGAGLLMDGLQAFMPSGALADEIGAQPAAGEPVVDPLTPEMRGALEFVSRRYRVSGDVLEPIFATAEASARALHIDPLLVVAVIAIESRFNPFSESVVGAQGLMQVMPRWHRDKLPEDADSFFDPVLNVQIGTSILKESIVRNGGLIPGLQQFAGASGDPERRYSGRVLAEKARLEAAVRRLSAGTV